MPLMIGLSFFYLANMAVVFILMLSSAALETQRNEKDKFFDLMTAIGEYFGGEFNEDEKALELDLNGANSFLEGLHRFATREIVRKKENGEFECKKSKKPDFKMAIQTILGENMRNLLKAIIVPQPIKSDGTLKEKQENSKDKIQTFLAVPMCFILPEWELSIFDYWIEIIKIKTEKTQKPIYGVAIYKKKLDKNKNESSKKRAFRLSRENYKILKQLNYQKFSIYESTKLVKAALNWGYSLMRGKIPEICKNLLFQIHWVLYFNWKIYDNYDKNRKCEYAILSQNISESLMKMMSDKGIDPEFHLDSQDKETREKVQKDVEESCKKFENEKAKIIFLNKVDYELAMNFEFNQRKDIHDRVEDLLINWFGVCWLCWREIEPLSEDALKKRCFQKLYEIKLFTSKKINQEAISIIEALIGKEHIHRFNLLSLFEQMKTLVEVAEKEEAKFWKAIKEINSEQLENDIEFLKKNPKNIDEEKYQKAVAIICTIKQFGEKVRMLKSEIKSSKVKKRLEKLSSTIQNYKMQYFGPELWEQTEEFCNQLKLNQIKMEEFVSKEILFADIYFEHDEICKNIEGGWKGIEEYYLSIPLIQLTEQAQTLAKDFEKMLQNVKEHYASKNRHLE